MIYSTNSEDIFDPFDLEVDVTPAATRCVLQKEPCDYRRALIMSFRLNDVKLQTEVIEATPILESIYLDILVLVYSK